MRNLGKVALSPASFKSFVSKDHSLNQRNRQLIILKSQSDVLLPKPHKVSFALHYDTIILYQALPWVPQAFTTGISIEQDRIIYCYFYPHFWPNQRLFQAC